jgi:hypothetical protein
MRSVIMRGLKTIILGVILMLACSERLIAQECESLRNAAPSDLASFLNGVVPDQNNAECVAWAIKQVGPQGEISAIPALVKLLDFRRPLDPREKKA